MAIKYVEDYRQSTLSDAATIQAAIDDLNDGDTLYFNKKETIDGQITTAPGTYVLSHPIHFTSCTAGFNEANEYITTGGRNLKGVTIDGCNCTIKNTSDFDINSVYGNVLRLFYLSDSQLHGMFNSRFQNFIFKCNSNNDETKKKFIAIGPKGNVQSSVYVTDSTISHCEFYDFGTGIYIGGKNVVIEHCKFESCYYGIDSDGTTMLDVHHNNFYTTKKYGLHLNASYQSYAYGNTFYKCKNNAIGIIGITNDSTYSKSLLINVYSNKIFGGEIKNADGTIREIQNQTGILCSGGKDVVIRDNIIKNMTYDSESPDKDDYGIGILLYGNNTTNNVKNSERVIVANNVITGSQRYGIKAGFASSCTICGNSIHSGERGAGADFGIYIKDTAGDLHVSDNALYHFADGKSIRTNKYNVQLNNNTIFDKDKKFDPFDPIRYIDTTVSDSNSSVIRIPDLPVALEKNDEFGILIPEGYSSSTVTSISYDGNSGYVYNGSNAYNFPSTDIGKYVMVQYYYVERESTGTKTISFYLVD